MITEFRSNPALLKAITDVIFCYISSNVLYEGEPLQLFKESVAKQHELKNVQKKIMQRKCDILTQTADDRSFAHQLIR